MGLFHSNYNKPGPGVRKDEPRKKGFARFAEVMGRDFGDLFRANVLCAACFIPALSLTFLGILCRTSLIAILGGFLGGILAGPCYAGLHDTILRALRDEPGYWWATYKKALAQNWKASLLPGGIMGLLLSSQIFMTFFILTDSGRLSFGSLIVMCLNILLCSMLFPYLFSQLVSMNLGFIPLVKNSLFLALMNAPKSLLIAFIQIVYWVAMIVILPYSGLWFLIFGVAFIEVIVLMIVFPILDKTFDLENKFKERREKELQEASEKN